MADELSTKTRETNHEQFTVVFRHPARHDPITGSRGRRVRRLLGTSDPGEADALLRELNQLLSDDAFWTADALASAESRFDPRVLSLFFDGMSPAPLDASVKLREVHMPLPTTEDDYRRVLMIGTTGAGKTTVIRQLLGTDPDRDRFPSTSTAKTTVADTEIIVREGVYRAIVTFFSRDEIIDHLTDCASRTALATLRGVSDADLRTMLLDHENQRFRFSYVLGRQSVKEPKVEAQTDEFDEFDEFSDPADEAAESESPSFISEPPQLGGVDLDATQLLVTSAVSTLKVIAAELLEAIPLQADSEDSTTSDRTDEQLDHLLRFDDRFNSIVDALVDEIRKRFDAQSAGTITRNIEGWPATWTYENPDRGTFLQSVNRFTSNYAPSFGHLLTPLVDGIRVSGPFRPTWVDGPLPKLVLVDGEGLGHTAKSSASLPTKVADMINQVDAVLLVDNAQQPMQAAPAAAIRSILTSGNIEKLIFCFTHFEEVRGDNLSSAADRAHHVLASVENLLSAIQADFGQRPAQALRERINGNRVFLSGIDKRLRDTDALGKWSIKQFGTLLDRVHASVETVVPGPSTPVYEKAALAEAIESATEQFHLRWRALLGIERSDTVAVEHWTRIKALNKRFADGTDDQYDTLRPSADLRELLKEDIYRTLESTLAWQGPPPSDVAEIASAVDKFSNAIARRIETPIRERLLEEPQPNWAASLEYSGTGSTSRRARYISEEIFDRKVEVANISLNAARSFSDVVIRTIEGAAIEAGVDLH